MGVFFGVAKISNIFLGCLKLLIFFRVKCRCLGGIRPISYLMTSAKCNSIAIFYSTNVSTVITEWSSLVTWWGRYNTMNNFTENGKL